MVRKSSFMFLTGPEVIKGMTGETIDAETLGGADTHPSISGTAHLAMDTEQEVLAAARRLFGYFPSNNVENPPFQPGLDDPLRTDVELNTIIPFDSYEPYSMHAVIQHVVDRDTFIELQPGWAMNAITGLARLGGHAVGIVAQEPSVMAAVIDIDAADKMARFVRMCDYFNIPLVTFVDSPGFLPGSQQEHAGIIRHGAKVLYAYSEATVPKVTVITRKAYGGAYVVMSSKFLGTDVTYAWPSAEIAVMGAVGAVNILFRRQIESSADPKGERSRLDARPVVVIVDSQAIEVWPEMDNSQLDNSTAEPMAVETPGKAQGMKGSPTQASMPASRALEKTLCAPIPGVILAVNVAAGDKVSPGQELFVIEAMKMRNAIRSNRTGKVAALHVIPGQTVNHNDVLIEFADLDDQR
jgi:acetyl-CoA carboxylase carboxyltransferase component